MSAREYIDSLSYQEFEKIKPLKQTSEFSSILASADCNPVMLATFGISCQMHGIPSEFTSSGEALHFLAIAINLRG